MSLAIVTGSSGLIGHETVNFLNSKGMDVIGIDNNLRAYFFGKESSAIRNFKKIKNFQSLNFDIRDQGKIQALFKKFGNNISLIIHTAAQPSHEWAAKDPIYDFSINAQATIYLLESTRKFAPNATFIFTSSNKVYGDTPNNLPLMELNSRWECTPSHHFSINGIDESMSIDQSKHSLFGVSKVSADIMCQEYGKYFGLKTGIFRCGCVTGPAHFGANLHGFLSYLVKCQLTGKPYSIYGYKGKQVRDNIHSYDLVNAFWNFYTSPQIGEVYNIGGSRYSNCSIIEAIDIIKEQTGKGLNFKLLDEPRNGDHIWWISDISKFKKKFPNWNYKYDIKMIISEIISAISEREQISL